MQAPVPAPAGACLHSPSLGPYPHPPRDGTQRTSSSQGAAGWRRTDACGRTRNASEECAARLEVAGLCGPATGRAMPEQVAAPAVADRVRPRPFPRPRPSPLPRPSPSPCPITPTRLLPRFCADYPAQPNPSSRRFPFVAACLRVLIRDLASSRRKTRRTPPQRFGVGPFPRATPACMHAGGPARGNPAGRGLRQLSISHKSPSVERGRGLLSIEPFDRTAASPRQVQSRSGSVNVG